MKFGTHDIEADEIVIGKDFRHGENFHIKVRGLLKIGDYCTFGDDVQIEAEDVSIGDHFFHLTPGLRVGGGGSQFPNASLTIGSRCVLHNNYINLAHRVSMGDDVGLSPDVDILTHGFWGSVLEGYPRRVAPVSIRDNVIVGQRSMILPGVHIYSNVVIGAASVVTKSIERSNCVYGGNPAKFIRDIKEPQEAEKMKIFDEIVECYLTLRPEHRKCLAHLYPIMKLRETSFNLITKEMKGPEDEDTDKFRDFLRRFGIKIYTSRGFQSI